MKKTKNLGIRPTGTTPLTGKVDGLEQSELSSSRSLHSPYIHDIDIHLQLDGTSNPAVGTTNLDGHKHVRDKYTTCITQKTKQNDFEPTGFLHVNGLQIRYKLLEGLSNEIGLHCGDAFSYIGIEKHINKNGFTFLNKHLEKGGFELDKCYLRKGRTYVYITLKAFLELLSSKSVSKGKKNFKEGLMEALSQDAAIGASIKKQMSTPKRNKFKSPVSVFSSTQTHKLLTKEHKKLILKRNINGNKKQTSNLKTELRAICAEHFNGSKNEMVRSFADLIRPGTNKKVGSVVDSSCFDGYFGIDDIISMLKNAKGKKKYGEKRNLLEQLIVTEAKDVFSFQPYDLIYLEENFSGQRLFDELRKKIPGIFPSKRVEQLAKRELKNEFAVVLLPKRTPSGWQIDPSRLMEVLRFKYHGSIDSNAYRHWKIYGDGRVIGGRQSTFVSISILNNEGFFVDGSFQNPKNVYPLNIFYESDSRDNLEDNLGFPCMADQRFREMKEDVFYLSGDEMFLEAMLDSSGELGPVTETGWNIYRKCDKKSKEITAEDGLRTSLCLKIDRQHIDRMFTTVPIERTVLCALHAITRCVEKFLNLEIQNILSEGNKETQRGGDGEGWKTDAIHNLEANISLRGIRHGDFRVLFDKSGNPEPVSLNKDHAIGIISPALPDFPHVLSGVVKKRKANLQVRSEVQKLLCLNDTLTEYEHVQLIWDHFYHMSMILLKDPLPVGASDDHTEFEWGYTEADMMQYKEHAEIFYQLFCARYTAKSLTPYMMKLIDHVPELMRTLPFPIARFQSEGGEHVSYQHNCFYYQHTTRHGGRGNQDPLVAIFQSMWNRLYYSIAQLTLSDNEEAREVGHSFIAFCSSHSAASVIQRWFRGYIVRRKLNKAGWTSKPLSGQQRKCNMKIKASLQNIFSTKRNTVAVTVRNKFCPCWCSTSTEEEENNPGRNKKNYC